MIVNDRLEGVPRNCIGPLFPTRDASAMARIFGIAADHRVLEVGGGFYPFERADVVTDISFSDASNRNGAQMMFRCDKTYVECAAETLPFRDREFDFAFCAHVLEHVADPSRALAEMARVAGRGFIEVPSGLSDYLAGNPTHRWLIDIEDGVLVFRRRNFLDSPLRNFLHAHVYNDPEFDRALQGSYRNLLNLQVAWVGDIPHRIEEADGDGFDYDDPQQAGRSHLLFAYNLHQFGTDPKFAVADAYEAVECLPRSADAWIVRGLYDARMLLLREAKQAFERALELRPGDTVARHDLAIVEAAAETGRFDAAELIAPESLSDVAMGVDFRGAGDDALPGAAAAERHEHAVTVVMEDPGDRGLFDEMFESVVAQRHTRRDIVLVTGDPVEAERRLARLRPACKITVVTVDPAMPRGDRLNQAHAHCRGDYVAYLTDDSIYSVHHLARLCELLEATGAAAAYSDATRIAYEEGSEGRRYGVAERCVLSPSLRPGDLRSDEPIPLSNLMHRREVFAGFDASLGRLQGRDFLLRISREARVEHLSTITTEYRSRQDSLGTAEDQARLLAEQRKVLANYSQFEPLELMRRVVELYNQNVYLKSRLAQLEEARELQDAKGLQES